MRPADINPDGGTDATSALLICLHVSARYGTALSRQNRLATDFEIKRRVDHFQRTHELVFACLLAR